MTDWLILRTNARHTMSLAKSLADDGYCAWTPVEHIIKNLPGNVKRPVTQAMFAGYVFARAAHLLDLLDVSRTPMRRGPGRRLPAHPRFWILRENDGRPAFVADCKLDNVRRLEARRTPPSKAEKALVIGSLVKVTSGPYIGLFGDVERSDCRKTKVRFNARHAAEFLTSQLQPDGLHGAQAAQDVASMVTKGAV